MEEKFYYEVSCSAPKLTPVEYIKVRYIGEDGSFRCFGNEFREGGLATGMDGVCRSRTNRYRLPKAIEATWVSFTDRKVYKVSSLIPYETILALFRDGGVPCAPTSEDPADDELTEEDNALINKSLESGIRLSDEEKRQLEKVFEKKERQLERVKSFDLCFLPGGKVVLYLKAPIKKILLDWSATGEEVTDDEVLSDVYMTYAKQDMESYYDVFYSEKFQDIAPWRKYMREYGSAGPLLDRYLERFNYTLALDFEDKNTTLCYVKSEFTNAEQHSFTTEYNEAFKMPARMKRSRMGWKTKKYYYSCFIYFNEEEVLRAYDEAFGDDRTQKGELRIKVSKRNDRFDLFLNVGDKSIRLEKTEIVNFIDPADAPDSEDTVIFENFDERTNYFADDELYHEELPRKED